MKKKEEQTRLYIPIFGILIILGTMLAIIIYLLVQIAITPESEKKKKKISSSSFIVSEQKKTNIPESKRETSYVLMEKNCNRNFSAESEDDGTIYFFEVGQKVQIIEYSPPYENYVVLVDGKLYLIPPNYAE